MDLSGIFSAFGLAASAGLNAYIPLLAVALLGRFTTLIQLAEPYRALTSGWIIALLIVLSLVEFLADKIHVVNHINDAVQTFVRPVAGAIAFAAATGPITRVHPVLALALGLLVAGSIHGFKSVVVRPAVSATTAGMGNVPVSIMEDTVATTVSVVSIVVPVFIAFLIALIAVSIVYLLWGRPRRQASSHGSC